MSDWTDDRVETLKKLVGDGASGGQIARRLGGVTREAVIGKVRRLGLRLKGRSAAHEIDNALRNARAKAADADGPRAPRAPTVKPVVVKDGFSLRAAAMADPSLHPPRVAIPAEPTAAGLTLVQLGYGMCRWPLAMQGGERTFCGDEAEVDEFGRCYCVPHRQRAFQSPKPGQPRTANELARSLRRYVS